MKKTQNDWEHWEKIFPEFEVQEIESNNSAILGDQTMQSTSQDELIKLDDISLTWDNWSNLTASGLPSLTANDIYSIDFANIGIGNLTTVNLSVLGSSSPIWTNTSYSNHTVGAVNINSNGTIQIPEGGDLKIGNVSLTDRLDRIESRLGILNPRPELEQEFEELRALGEQYRVLEKEIQDRLKTFETLKRE